MRPLRGLPPETWASRRIAVYLALVGCLGTAAYLRIRRMFLLDIFEDGYHHWWIGAHWAETGQYVDPFSKMTEGNWLPGYYPIAGGLFSVAGWDAILALRFLSLVASLATIVLVFVLTRKHGPVAALSAAFFQALVIEDALIGSMATPESLTTLLFVIAVYLLWHRQRRKEINRSIVAGALLVAAATLRYEIWIAVALLPIYGWFFERARFRSLVLAAMPSFVWMILWTAALSPIGFLPQIVLGQTSREAQNEISLGVIAVGPYARLWVFWISRFAAGLFPLFFLGPAYMIYRQRREFTTILAVILFAALSLIVALGLGTGSYRYLAVVVPFLSVSAGRAVGRIVALIRRSWPRHALSIGGAALAFLVIACVANALWITPALDGLGTLQAPLERAGNWIREQPWPAGKDLLSDSPVATYFSRVDPAHVWSSFWLPGNRSDALRILKADYAFVVFVNVSYYPLVTLFPELRGGASTPDFVLSYDPNGWELAYGAKQVFVYAVRP